MYKVTTPNSLYLVGKIHEILDYLYIICRDNSSLQEYLEKQKSY
ncbi:MAG: hypothetical protein QME73_07210 [Bacillota bacterium]|nr:hypothetical protein [Bacillota bacterium]